MTELIHYRHAAFHSLMSEVDRIVAVSSWVKDVLVRNQVPPAKITVIRQGLCHTEFALTKDRVRRFQKPP